MFSMTLPSTRPVTPLRHALELGALWLLLVLVSLYGRSFIPIDETRYVSVAWDMWLRGDFLVPHLNGHPYSDKPPMLFWLMQIGWAIFGVNDWWPRVVPSFFALACAWLTARIALRLWPREPMLAHVAPVVLLGSLLWTVFTTATMFDILITFFAMLGVLGLLVVLQDKNKHGWWLLGFAIGGGLLAKGPAILLHVLPLALLAPWWGRSSQQRWRRWYAGILFAILTGAAIALAWAIPAAMRGGPEYEHAIFWGQTADRMVNSFAHQRPLWWYLPLLPVMLFPWLFWMPFWRGIQALGPQLGSTGLRFCLAWLVPVFLAFSMISGKQMHYLLPLFPAFSLLVARAALLSGSVHQRDGRVAAVVAIMAGFGLLALPYYARSHALAPWMLDVPAWSGLLLVLGGLLAFFLRGVSLRQEVWKMTLLSGLVVFVLYVGVIRVADDAYDVRPISARLRLLEEAGTPIMHVGRYPATFDFLGRLHRSPDVRRPTEASAWFAQHPDGRAIVYFDRRNPQDGVSTEFEQDYQGDRIAIVTRAQWEEWWMRHLAAPARKRD